MSNVSISTFNAWVTIEGQTCPVFALKHINRRSAMCWIPSQEGKKFSVNWSNSFREKPVHAELSIDGVVCSTHYMLDLLDFPDDPSAIGISYATTSDFTRRDFVFSAIQVTDDDAYLYTLDSPPTFGTIQLELWEADIQQIERAPFQHRYGSDVLEGQTIHEMSKKAGSHHVTFGGEYVVPRATVNMVTGIRKGDAPLASFTFNYRPFDILRAGGIIPPSPSQTIVVKSEPVDDRIRDLEAQIALLRAQKAEPSRPSRQKNDFKTHWGHDSRSGKTVQVIDLTDL
ncbi:hypothetical protein R3P38DRAFT_2905241 [Favolaschia claudopus]|uniref:DUF7918 domain-containing protein n=1 Tax=Favolaschia claudopus TaxID=2862362 RepID=A0AAW0CF90_9AGAR